MKYGKYVILFIFVAFLALVSSAQASWWNNDWNHMRVLTVESDYINEPLTGFPLLVVLPQSINEMSDDGNSIRFLSIDNTTEFDYEIEEWNNTGDSYIWVNVSETIMHNEDYNFLLYYNNTGASDNQNPTDVWDGNYFAVWHMNGSSATTVTDSTINNVNSIENLSTSIVGKIGLCREYSPTTHDRFPVGVPEPSNFTMSLWVRPYNNDGQTAPFIAGKVGGWGTQIYSNKYAVFMDGADDPSDFITNIFHSKNDIGWDYFVWTFRTDDGYDAYINGTYGDTKDDAGAKKDYGDGTGVLSFGNRYPGYWHAGSSWLYNGSIDEIRVSNIERNASWINASFNNQNQSTDFLIIHPASEKQSVNYTVYPLNQSTELCPCCITLCVNVDSNYGSIMNITFYSNLSLPYWDYFWLGADKNVTYSNVTDGSYCFNVAPFNEYDTTYYWNVSIDDGTNVYQEGPFYFTTAEDYEDCDFAGGNSIRDDAWIVGLVLVFTVLSVYMRRKHR